ncbi:MAG: CopG family transcriptional regulator [bacterium]|nr:CopG family transcriptional regulator [bacterium]
METTLIIDDAILTRLQEEAARHGQTPSELVEAALRAMLPKRKVRHQEVPPLPSYHGGEFLVDVANRDALYEAMENE